jgi:hypothetical protein
VHALDASRIVVEDDDAPPALHNPPLDLLQGPLDSQLGRLQGQVRPLVHRVFRGPCPRSYAVLSARLFHSQAMAVKIAAAPSPMIHSMLTSGSR